MGVINDVFQDQCNRYDRGITPPWSEGYELTCPSCGNGYIHQRDPLTFSSGDLESVTFDLTHPVIPGIPPITVTYKNPDRGACCGMGGPSLGIVIPVWCENCNVPFHGLAIYQSGGSTYVDWVSAESVDPLASPTEYDGPGSSNKLGWYVQLHKDNLIIESGVNLEQLTVGEREHVDDLMWEVALVITSDLAQGLQRSDNSIESPYDMTGSKYRGLLSSVLPASNTRGEISGSPEPEEWVYVLHDPGNDLIKIGRSRNPLKRLRTHRGSNPRVIPICAFPGSVKEESDLHSQFTEHRLPGATEWFMRTTRIAEWVDEQRVLHGWPFPTGTPTDQQGVV